MSLLASARGIVALATRHGDLALVGLLVAGIAMMILPLPTRLVDALIGATMALSFAILMVTMYVRTPLEFSAFPTILLFTTLFRVGLNITTTRLILLNADAGEIIQTFGESTGKNLVGYVRYFTDNAMSMGVVSILSFGVTFVLLIDKIYTMVNRFYHAGPGKIYIRYLKYVAFIVGGILAIAGMVFFIGRFNSFSAKLLNLPAIGYVGRVVKLLVPIAVIFGVMFSIIKFIPNCKVRTSSCLLGAGVGTVGIWVLGFIFQFIVRRSVKYSVIYGSLATLLFFFMFLSYLWKIVFSAVIASYVHQKIAESKAVKTE